MRNREVKGERENKKRDNLKRATRRDLKKERRLAKKVANRPSDIFGDCNKKVEIIGRLSVIFWLQI